MTLVCFSRSTIEDENAVACNKRRQERTRPMETHPLDECACWLSEQDGMRWRPTRTKMSSSSDILMHLSAVRVLLSTRRRIVDANATWCPKANRVCSELLSDVAWTDWLVDTALRSSNEYVGYVATCVASEVIIGCTDDGKALIDKLLLSITAGHRVTAAAAVNVFARVLNAADNDTDDGTACRNLTRRRSHTKKILFDRLKDRWSDAVDVIIGENTMACTPSLIELLRLWKSVLLWPSLEKNGTTHCPHHGQYYTALAYLHRYLYRTDTHPHVWLNTIRLFSASLQSCICTVCSSEHAQSSYCGCCYRKATAREIVSGIIRRRLLYFMGKIGNGFGRDNEFARKIVQETALLAMRSLRVLAAKHGVDTAGDKGDTVVVIENVVNCLDSYVKSSTMFDTRLRFYRWLVRLLCDRDDAIVECLTCGLDVATAVPASWPLLDPFDGFAEMLAYTGFGPDVLLDYLISNENDFLPYVLIVLKTACRDIERFVRSCGDRLDNTIGTLNTLRLKMLRLREKNVFPYNIDPLAKLIERCDKLCSEIVL